MTSAIPASASPIVSFTEPEKTIIQFAAQNEVLRARVNELQQSCDALRNVLGTVGVQSAHLNGKIIKHFEGCKSDQVRELHNLSLTILAELAKWLQSELDVLTIGTKTGLEGSASKAADKTESKKA